MESCCPTCGHRLAEPERHDTITAWKAHCAEQGIHVMPDGRVAESVAAALLGIAVGTLENRRRGGSGPPAVRVGVRGSRWSYRLADLAAWVELHRYTDDD